MYRMRAASMAEIQALAATSCDQPAVTVLRAGECLSQPAPGGMAGIISRRTGGAGSLGTTGGLTLIKSAAAFTIPAFNVRTISERGEGTVRHYAEVQRTTSEDAVHESFFPAAGDHLRPGMTHRARNRVYRHFWRVSGMTSRLIRRGEEEHLADARRAYEITYKLIADTINAMAGQRFGPASTPSAAQAMAETRLQTELPSALGTNPRDWVTTLDRLLLQTKTRDSNGWHGISVDPPITRGTDVFHPVVATASTSVGATAPAEVVNY